MATTTNRWRTIDIVIASIVAVAFGVIFWAWGLLWNGPADAIPLPGRAVLYGMWLVPAVLGALIVRKPGAAFYTLTLASLVSATRSVRTPRPTWTPHRKITTATIVVAMNRKTSCFPLS